MASDVADVDVDVEDIAEAADNLRKERREAPSPSLLDGIVIDARNPDVSMPTLRCTSCGTALVSLTYTSLADLIEFADTHARITCPAAAAIPYLLTEKD